MDFINLNGEIETLTFKQIKQRVNKPISWEHMHNINKHMATYDNKKYVDFLKKYGQELTIFNFNNIVEWQHLQIYPYFIEIALKNGAIDKRDKSNTKK